MNFRETRKTGAFLAPATVLRPSIANAMAIALLAVAPFSEAATTFGPEQLISTAVDGAQTVFSVDIDGDGDNDAVSAALQGGEIAWFENVNGDGSLWTKRQIAAVSLGKAAFAADVDGDNDIDVLSAAGDVIRWHENDGAKPPVWTTHTIASNVFSSSDVWAGDIDGDGNIDAVSASVTNDRITWHENANANGDGLSWTAHIVTSNVDGIQAIDGSDVDGDGDIDLLGVAGGNTTNKVSWFENGNAWAEDQISSFVPGFLPQLSSVHAVDIDGDMDIDVLASGASPFVDPGRIWLWRNTAAALDPPSWSNSTIDFAQGDAVFAADLDGDGDQDVMKTHRTNDDVSWYENLNGLGTSWSKTTIGTADGGRDVFAADVDGDSDFDILAASSSDDTVAWYENAPAAAETYSVGGNVTGLTGTGLALQNNSTDTLVIAADGSFTFLTELEDGFSYVVTVSTQPTGQTCTVTNDMGVISSADVTNVVVTCVDDVVLTYSVGGNVTGLTGTGLALQNNGADTLAIAADGPFTFLTELVDTTAYAVTVSTQPTGQTCTVTSSSGVIAAADVTNVSVTCEDDVVPTYSVGGNITGLAGTGLALQNNGADTLAIAANGPFTFLTELEDAAAYAVTVSAQPTGQTCSVTSGSGVIAAADVTSVSVTCVDDNGPPVEPPAPVIPIPTMSQWALITLSMLLGLMVFANRRRLF